MPLARAVVGARELRLASERAMRSAAEPLEVVRALALLPGEEARPGLRQLVGRLGHLRAEAGDGAAIRSWRVLSSCERLVRLLEPSSLARALKDDRLDFDVTAQLLRAHPTAAVRLCGRAPRPRSPAASPAASGRRSLARRPCARPGPPVLRLQAPDVARHAAAGSRPASPIPSRACATSSGRRSPEARSASAAKRGVGRGLRPGDPGDTALARYRRWRLTGARDEVDPVVALLSGAWQHGAT